MEYYVYSRQVESGREELLGIYDSWSAAIEKVTRCYDIDKTTFKGLFYYFIKERG